jgi:hypothetical protein
MYKKVLSKIFANKIRGFSQTRRKDVLKAVERVLVNPELDAYRRPYLHPYRQEHPSDKTLTIFFVIPARPPSRVFFVWVNDDQHSHDTHKNHGDDPCVKEFIRLRDSGSLEQYSEDEHEGEFTVNPRTGPSFVKFQKYNASVFSNVSHDGTTHYSMAITSMNAVDEIFDHYELFIRNVREYYLSQGQKFEFRIFQGDTSFQNLISNNADHSSWDVTQSGGMEIWSI